MQRMTRKTRMKQIASSTKSKFYEYWFVSTSAAHLHIKQPVDNETVKMVLDADYKSTELPLKAGHTCPNNHLKFHRHPQLPLQ
jgi:hypothetical protein